MKDSHHSENKERTELDSSFFHHHKPVIMGMGGGVLLGIVMGSLLNDPALGMAFGLAVGGGAWYTMKKDN